MLCCHTEGERVAANVGQSADAGRENHGSQYAREVESSAREGWVASSRARAWAKLQVSVRGEGC